MKSRLFRKPPSKFHAHASTGGYRIIFKKNIKTRRGSRRVLSAMLPVAIRPTITVVAK
jgi:hypothetical protein